MTTTSRRSSSRARLVAGASLAAVLALVAFGRESAGRKRMVLDEDFGGSGRIGFDGPAIGGRSAPAADAPAYLAGGAIAAIGNRTLVIDADSGELVLADAKGGVLSRLAIGVTSAQLVFDTTAQRAYVADRAGDRVVQVDLVGDKLKQVGAFATETEPFGLALAPDRSMLLVTTVAGRSLTAYDPQTGETKWSHALGREPRGVAISPDGKRAAVGYLATGTIELIDLTSSRHAGRHIALEAPATGGAQPVSRRKLRRAHGTAQTPTSGDTGRAFARNAFAVQFIGHGLTVAAHSLSTPIQSDSFRGENTGSYGGGFSPPIVHRLAFMAGDEAQVGATVQVHQPQAIAWDPRSDSLYVAGYGSDDVVVIDAASQANARLAGQYALGQSEPCGPQGLAVADDGTVRVWCGLSRTVATMTRKDGAATFAVLGSALTKTRLSKDEHRGMVLFRMANDGRLSSRGALACASCHPEGRADGLSWRIEQHELQTPLLSGKVAGTHPFKWDGGDKDLPTSLTSTMRRLGGGGLPADDSKALAKFLEQMPAPRTAVRSATAVARGKQMFDGELGCATCHAGTQYTDNERHEFGSATLPHADTPALVGLAFSAPYFHDGSAATLEALLADNGLVHGMAETSALTDAQIDDLVAYLETL
jgi:DNA-binding beta-propeller fold protein YncE